MDDNKKMEFPMHKRWGMKQGKINVPESLQQRSHAQKQLAFEPEAKHTKNERAFATGRSIYQDAHMYAFHQCVYGQRHYYPI